MKKIILAFLIITLPLGLFADFYLGGTALYKDDPKYLEGADETIIDDLAFGAVAQLNIAMIEGSAMALYEFDGAFDLFLDVGLTFDVAIFTIGVGIGPNFIIQADPDAPDPTALGFNGKLHVDLNLGDIKISGYYMILVENLAAEDFEDSLTFGNVGLSVLFKL
jgi:hypothetical protein